MYLEYTKNGFEAGNKIMKEPGTGFDDASAQAADVIEAMVQNLNKESETGNQEVNANANRILWLTVVLGILVIAVVLFTLNTLLRKNFSLFRQSYFCQFF